MDHANRAVSAGASVLPSTGPGPPPSAPRITKKPIVLRDRGRPIYCTCFLTTFHICGIDNLRISFIYLFFPFDLYVLLY